MLRRFISGALIGILFVMVMVVAVGWAEAPIAAAQSGDDMTAAAPIAEPEACAVCHSEAGADHQAAYDELYQDGVIQVTDLAYSFSSPDTSTVTFKMTKDGAPFDGNDADALSIYFAPYTGEEFQFEPAAGRLSLKGEELTYDGEGVTTSTVAGTPDLSMVDGLITVYGRDEVIARLPNSRVYQNKYPFAAILETGAGVDYVSPANNDGCEKCHTVPYLKHSYIYGQVDHDPATDFLTCKACHLDNGEGGHFEWQMLVDDPALAAEFMHDEDILTDEMAEKYAYSTSLMNDVHMSHAMEFPYPQSMATCATCHEGKLDTTLADENFTLETCKSCHPMTGSEEYGTAERSIDAMLALDGHEDLDLEADACNDCHRMGKKAAGLREIHSGYDEMIYAADDLKYSEAISVTIDSASLDGDMLTFAFSAGENPDLEGLDVADIVPTAMVGLYGYDTKDYIVGPHERLFDDNGDGEISRSSGDSRALEYVVGEKHPRFATVSTGDGSWEVVADLSPWTDLIADETVKRVEFAVMPELVDADGVTLALNAPSRTFDLASNAFDDEFYDPIVKLTDGCENCHDALATSYHSADRGGNIVVCRMCHITKSRGSHLELQSRSLDSYVHAVHSFQAFDIGDIDFNDPVAALNYEHHIGFPYPTHALTNCESCHVEGAYEVPDQSKSLPGALSATDAVEDRKIGDIPLAITGPAARACGGCHRAELINADDIGGLVAFNQHMKREGYLVDGGEDYPATLLEVIDEIMAYFE